MGRLWMIRITCGVPSKRLTYPLKIDPWKGDSYWKTTILRSENAVSFQAGIWSPVIWLMVQKSIPNHLGCRNPVKKGIYYRSLNRFFAGFQGSSHQQYWFGSHMDEPVTWSTEKNSRICSIDSWLFNRDSYYLGLWSSVNNWTVCHLLYDKTTTYIS